MLNVRPADGLTVVELEHGPVNALDLELLDALVKAFAGLEGPVVLTGAGRAFSAGVDLRRIVEDGDDYISRFLTRLSEALLAVFVRPYPTVAAVNGHAIAGGAILAFACDTRLMSGGTIGLAELPVGVAFPRVALEIVRHALGPAAMRTVLLGATVGPGEAVQRGLVDEVVSADDLLEQATEQAQTLARVPQELYAATKRELQAAALKAIDTEPDTALPVWTSPETKRRLADYLATLGKRG